MCGIAGFVSADAGHGFDERCLRRMRDVITHRGPDDEGLWMDRNVGLAHRRLSIVDVGQGHQPMTNEDGTIWIVFNGEIYNHADLRPELEARGHHYRSRSDTETIIHLYEEYGDAAVTRLHGMFAFALWDGPRRRLLIARDRLGIKPLYYAETGKALVFGSEIKAILAAGVQPRFDQSVLPEFLASRYVAGDGTFFDGIKRLPPGHTMTWSAETGLRQQRYWSVPPPARKPAASFAVEAADLRERLEKAVRRHLMSDVPLGVFLSGGLDSSALAAMTARMVTEPLQTFSVGFAEEEANELPYARSVAKHIGAIHRDVQVSPAEYFDALPQLIWHEDEPIAFTSSVPLYFVSKLASKHVKVVLTGEGADELFLGYNRYRVTHWNAKLGRPYWSMVPRAVRGRASQLIAALPRAVRRYPQRTFLALEPGIRSLFFENFACFPEPWRHRLLGRNTEAATADPYAVALDCYATAEGSSLDRLSRADLQTYLHELLMKQDQMSMAASIESRVPFLDDEIIEHVAALPGRLKLRGWETKAVLRAAIKDLIPAEILTRRKMGFPVPIGRWLRGPFWPLVEEFVLGGRATERGLFDVDGVRQLAHEHRAGAAEHGDRLWLLMNLEMWHRVFIEGEDPQHLTRPSGRRQTAHAYSLGQDRWPVAAHVGR
jgi:asparagine synthase (glutamine-hydrolysing)